MKNAVTILNTLGQKYFLRPSHLSRLQPPELTDYYMKTLFKGRSADETSATCKKIYHLFVEGRYIAPIFPTCQTPANILILGATMMVIWKRIAFFNELVRTHKITLSDSTTITLCIGERTIETYEQADLHKVHNDHNHLLATEITDEVEGGKSLLEIFPFCDAVKRESIHVAIGRAQPGKKTATTGDNISTWLSMPYHYDGSTLVISSNPYVEYQTEAIRLCFAQHNHCSHLFSQVESAGFGSHLTADTFTIKDTGVYLDNIARTLFTLTKIYEIVEPSSSWMMRHVYELGLLFCHFFHKLKNVISYE